MELTPSQCLDYCKKELKHNGFHWVKPKNTEKAFEFFQEMCADKNSKTGAPQDPDPDGIFSVKVFDVLCTDVGYDRFYPYAPPSKVHGLCGETVLYAIQQGFTHMVIMDHSVNAMDEIKQLVNAGIKILIIDHHSMDYKEEDYPEGVIIVSTEFEENKEIQKVSAGFLVFLLTSYWRAMMKMPISYQSMVWAYITLISDSCELEDPYIKSIILSSQSLLPYRPPELLLFCNNWSTLDRNWLTYKFNNVINACCRMDRMDLLQKVFFDDIPFEDKADIITIIRKIYEDACEDTNQLIENHLEDFIEIQGDFIYANLDKALALSSLPRNYLINSTGLLASKISSKLNLPCIAYIYKSTTTFKCSGRDTKNKFPFLSMLKALDLDGGGHPGAVGFEMPCTDIDRIKDFVSNESSKYVDAVGDSITVVYSPNESNDWVSIFKHIALYNEIASHTLNPINVVVKLDSTFTMQQYKKSRGFFFGTFSVKDTSNTICIGDTVEAKPCFTKPNELLIAR